MNVYKYAAVNFYCTEGFIKKTKGKEIWFVNITQDYLDRQHVF